MKIQFNGEEKEVNDGITVLALVEELNIGNKRFAVELNEEILPRGRLPETLVSEGDRIEVVVAIGGG